MGSLVCSYVGLVVSLYAFPLRKLYNEHTDLSAFYLNASPSLVSFIFTENYMRFLSNILQDE